MTRLCCPEAFWQTERGAPLAPGDLLIGGDRILEIGHFAMPSQIPTIDCTGLIVAPGFIDGHSHSDLQVLENRPEKIAQGVTTEVVGNCGFFSLSGPAKQRRLSGLRQWTLLWQREVGMGFGERVSERGALRAIRQCLLARRSWFVANLDGGGDVRVPCRSANWMRWSSG
jgi:hypothetical protein